MGCLGVHFALDEEQVAALRATDEMDRVDYVTEEIEEKFWSANKTRGHETDKAWDAIHRALTDGDLAWDNGTYPLNHVILGGEVLYGEDDYVLSLKTPSQVRDIVAALDRVTETSLRAGYDRIDPDDAGCEIGDDDFEYTWDYFVSLVEFYRRAAADGRYILFTADQ
jgi:hypothetical protein